MEAHSSTPTPINYSVVVPVYNSTQSVRELVERLNVVFNQELKQSYEVILVDDASPNIETWPTLQKLVDEFVPVQAIQLMRNFGKQGAVLCGFANARGKFIITMDDDLQHLPEDIPALISEQGHDVVVGRFGEKNHSFLKKVYSNIKSWFDYKLIGKPKNLRFGPFKLYQRTVVEHMLRVQTPFPFIPALIFMVTRDVVNVKIGHGKRKFGRSQFTMGKMLKLFSNLIINNSSFLLKWIAGLGITMSLVSFGLAIFYLIKKLAVGIGVPGWTTTIVIILLTSGLVLLSVGITGEYLLRIIKNVERTPPYLIREHLHHESVIHEE